MNESPDKSIDMPELLVFIKAFLIGLTLAGTFHIANLGGDSLASEFSGLMGGIKLTIVLFTASITLLYAVNRGATEELNRLWISKRVDLSLATVLGLMTFSSITSELQVIDSTLRSTSPIWAKPLTGLLILVLVSALWRSKDVKKKPKEAQIYFLSDEEVEEKKDDILGIAEQANSFALTLLASSEHSGLVFGLDGPWGIGKTSFINFAERIWLAEEDDPIIVSRFEPTRYSGDPDLADRFIRDLTSSIQSRVFVPELRPAVSRYSRMLKSNAEVSFLGIKLSLSPASDTIDELLADIDSVLRRMEKRLIIVIDDLDRLDAKSINTVLFMIQRTFKLSQAVYILCYDTEVLLAKSDDGAKARDFLEKFVNVKLSLFVDTSVLSRFLRTDWKADERKFPSIPSDTMLKLSSVLSELAEMLDGSDAPRYMAVLGDLRKIKRFINALLLIKLEKTDLGRTDFNRQDLVNLVLLYLNYPDVFRRIYAEETEGRSGTYSVKRSYKSGSAVYSNDSSFDKLVSSCDDLVKTFILKSLFDVKVLALSSGGSKDESFFSSRACFNDESNRNLETYLKLIVRLSVPEPRETFILYQDAVARVMRGDVSIAELLREPLFSLPDGEPAHDQFWRVFASQASTLSVEGVDPAIDALVEFIPHYSTISSGDQSLRQRSIYTLIRLLDRAGWKAENTERQNNSPKAVVIIAARIFGEGKYAHRGLIARLAAADRGVLGWSDLMLFRLQCSADRQGQVFNVHSALIYHGDMEGVTTGLVSGVALAGMRNLSQTIFAVFNRTFIVARRNFFAEVDDLDDSELLGLMLPAVRADSRQLECVVSNEDLENKLQAERSRIKSFVIYQLTNRLPPNGAGVGCGFYDEIGINDLGGIGAAMDSYVFDYCFNPIVDENNTILFADFCLSHLTSAVWAGSEGEGFVATETSLFQAFDLRSVRRYWETFGAQIKEKLNGVQRRVVTLNYEATYSDDLSKVYAVLDRMNLSSPASAGP